MDHRAQRLHGSSPPFGLWRARTAAPPGLAGYGHSPRRRLLTASLLGVNLWGMALLWPLFSARETTGSDLWLALAGLLPLVLGVLAHGLLGDRTQLARLLAGTLLLVAYPGALVALLALRPEADNQLHHGPVALALLWLSLCAYGASAAASCAARPASIDATHTPLGSEPWDAAAPQRFGLRRVVIALFGCGAGAVAVIAPALGGHQALRGNWGDAALAGGVLTAVVGAALGVAVLGVFLGSALRRTSVHPARGDAALRAAWFALLAVLGGVTYFVVQP